MQTNADDDQTNNDEGHQRSSEDNSEDEKEESISMLKHENLESKEEKTGILNTLKTIYKEDSVQRSKVLSTFFVSKIVFLSLDIITDISTASDYFTNGDFYWGLFTSIIIFAPMFAQLLRHITKHIENVFKKFKRTSRDSIFKDSEFVDETNQDLLQIFWQFPLLLPIRNIRTFIALCLMDINLPQNSDIVRRLKQEAVGSGLIEAFLESAPQLIFQLSIVLRTGVLISVKQSISIFWSFVSLTMASIQLFYMQRLGPFSEVDPSIKMKLFAGLPVLFLLAGPVSMLVLFATYFSGFVLVYIALIILANHFVMSRLRLNGRLNPPICEIAGNKYKDEDEYTISKAKEIQAIRQGVTMFWTAILTSWIANCTVWANNFRFRSMFLFLTNVLSLSLHCFGLVFMAVYLHLVDVSQCGNPPMMHCFIQEEECSPNSEYRLYQEGNSTNGLLEFCRNNCLPVKRICSDQEQPTDQFYKVILPIEVGLIVLSLFGSFLLQGFGNYDIMFRLSHRIFCEDPIMNSSYLHDLMKNHARTRRLFIRQLIQDSEVKLLHQKDSVYGETALHVAFNCELYDLLKIMEKKGCNFRINNNEGRNVEELLREKLGKEKETSHTPEIRDLLRVLKDRSDNEKEFKSLFKQTMHQAVVDNDLGLLCFLSIMGGNLGTQNDSGESVISSLWKRIEAGSLSIESQNFIIRWWLKMVTHKNYRILIHKSAENGMIKCLKQILSKQINVNIQDSSGHRTPLHYAARRDQEECLRALLLKEALVDVRDTFDQTPLHVAAEFGSLRCAEILIGHSADVNHENDNGTSLFMAAKNGHLPIVKLLLRNEADIEATDSDGSTPLLLSCKNGHLAIVQFILEENTCDKMARDDEGNTALHLAAEAGAADVVKYLTEIANIAIEERNEMGETPLHLACKEGHLDVIKYFVCERNSNLETKSDYGDTYLSTACEFGQLKVVKFLLRRGCENHLEVMNDLQETPLHSACRMGELKIVKYLIEKRGANVEANGSSGKTPLLLSVSVYENRVAKYLVEKAQANVEARNDDGEDAFLIACGCGNFEMAKYMIANKGVGIDTADNNGNTGLHKLGRFNVSINEKVEIAKFLIERGANKFSKNGENKIPIDIIKPGENQQLFDYLESVTVTVEEESKL